MTTIMGTLGVWSAEKEEHSHNQSKSRPKSDLDPKCVFKNLAALSLQWFSFPSHSPAVALEAFC